MYVPVAFAVMVDVVAPPFHAYVPPPDAVSITLSGVQNVVGPNAVIEADGAGLTVTAWLADAVHPAALLTVTL